MATTGTLRQGARDRHCQVLVVINVSGLKFVGTKQQTKKGVTISFVSIHPTLAAEVESNPVLAAETGLLQLLTRALFF